MSAAGVFLSTLLRSLKLICEGTDKSYVYSAKLKGVIAAVAFGQRSQLMHGGHKVAHCCHWTRKTQHNQANNSGRKQWVQEDCLQAVKVLWKTCKELLKTNDDITSKETADELASGPRPS